MVRDPPLCWLLFAFKSPVVVDDVGMRFVD